MRKKILYITSSVPSLTLTFIYREIKALEKIGVQIDIVSMKRPDTERVSIEARPLLDRVLFLDQVSAGRLLLSALGTLVTQPVRFFEMLGAAIVARPRKGVRDIFRLLFHFMQAMFLNRHIDTRDFEHIHSHFVSGASSIAMFLSGLCKVPFSFTMHGSQIYIDPIGLGSKLERCRFAISISDFHRQHVLRTYGAEYSEKLHVVRCGIDMEQFPARSTEEARRGGKFTILGVARLVEVKGFEYLIRACAELKRKKMDFVCKIVGDGPLADSLNELTRELDVDEYISFEGAKLQSELTDYFAAADVFCLPCVVDGAGSCDGLPVVLMEAMAWELPVISSRLVGIPELVETGKHGILVEPEDVNGIAEAISYVHAHPDESLAWGREGRQKVAGAFNVAVSAEQMKKLFLADG